MAEGVEAVSMAQRPTPPALHIDLPIEVFPYPRVTVHLPRSRRGPSWTNNPDALAKLNAFYDEFGWRLAGTGLVHARIEGPLSVRIWIWKKSRRGDIDNLAKSVLDALTRYGVWLDDSQVKSLHVEDVKRGTAPRLVVDIESIDAMLAILGVLVGCHVCRCPGCKGTGSVDGVPVGRVCGRCEGSGIWIERLV